MTGQCKILLKPAVQPVFCIGLTDFLAAVGFAGFFPFVSDIDIYFTTLIPFQTGCVRPWKQRKSLTLIIHHAASFFSQSLIPTDLLENVCVFTCILV